MDATSARSALFEPVLRDGQVSGVLIVIWQLPIESVPDGTAGMLRLLAAQAAVAIEHAGLRARMETLTLTDELTGVATRRVFEDELPRELARARRSETPWPSRSSTSTSSARSTSCAASARATG